MASNVAGIGRIRSSGRGAYESAPNHELARCLILIRRDGAINLSGTVRIPITVTEIAGTLSRSTREDDVALIIADVQDAGGAIAEALMALPPLHTPILLRTPIAGAHTVRALELARHHPDVRTVIDGQDDLCHRITSTLSSRRCPLTARDMMVRHYVSTGGREPTVFAAICLSYPRVSVGQLARACGMSLRHLERTLARRNLPGPRHLLSLTSCAQIAWLIESLEWSIKMVAYRGGFSSVQALTHLCTRYTGKPPSQLARDVGFTRVCEVWRQKVGCTAGEEAEPAQVALRQMVAGYVNCVEQKRCVSS